MNFFTVLFFCIQVCLVQNACSQYVSRGRVGDIIDIMPRPECLPPPLAYDGLTLWGGIAPADAALAPGLAAPYGLASPLAYDGLAAAAAPFGYRAGLGELAYPAALGWVDEIEAIAPYSGVGEGNVEVAGELPVAGTTAVAGQVPIMGAVNFGGPVTAAGAVTITGQCACGAPVEYLY